MKHAGGCHCGAVTVEFESAAAPAQLDVRACQCSFCRKHNTLAIADAAGQLTVRARDAASLNRYRFGLETAEYLLCAHCGVYVAAVTVDEGEPRAICIVNALDDRVAFTREPLLPNYDAETREERVSRRELSWTPVDVVVG